MPRVAFNGWVGPALVGTVPLDARGWFPAVGEPVGGPSFVAFQEVEDVVVIVAPGVACSLRIALVVGYPACLNTPITRTKAVKPVDEVPFHVTYDKIQDESSGSNHSYVDDLL